MGLMKGGVKFGPRYPSGWYNVQIGSGNATITKNGSVLIDFSRALKIITDHAPRYRIFIHAVGWTVDGSSVIPSSTNKQSYCTGMQRAALWTMQVTQPNVQKPMFNRVVDCAQSRFICQQVNPVAYTKLKNDLMTTALTFHRSDVDILSNFAAVSNPNNYPHHNDLDGWDDDRQLQTVTQDSGSTVTESWTDSEVIPLCINSGNFANDRLPLTAFTYQTNPVQIQITLNNDPVSDGLFPTPGSTVLFNNLRVWAYLSFERLEDSCTFGVPWYSLLNNYQSQNLKYNPGLYLASSVMPATQSATVDANGARIYYEPNTTIGLPLANIRQNDDSDLIFPLQQNSLDPNATGTYWLFYQWVRLAAKAGALPDIKIHPTIDSRFSGLGFLPGTKPTVPGLQSIIGYTSTCPVVPIVRNCSVVRGFPTGFYSRYNAQANLQVLFDSGSGAYVLPTTNSNIQTFDTLYNDCDSDIDFYKGHVETGNPTKPTGNWTKVTLHRSAGSPLVDYMVPNKLNRKAGQ